MGSLRVSIEEKFGTLAYFLIYAILEWLVIILLFVDGFLAFLSNEIARLFELRIPCLLCTRLDHVLVHCDSNFYYNDSICEVHKKDISTLAYCHVHKKISDIRTMCQGCLLSFTMDKDSDCDRYKSVAGIMHKDAGCLAEHKRLLLKPLRKDDMEITHDDNIGILRCSCCGDALKPKSCSKLNRSLSMSAPASSPRAPWFPGRNEDGGNLDLPSVRYTELKLSDHECELLHDDEHPSHAHNHGKFCIMHLFYGLISFLVLKVYIFSFLVLFCHSFSIHYSNIWSYQYWFSLVNRQSTNARTKCLSKMYF